ncbi:23S rRNA (pseudouridine(1915)-N(3))-methyltransferase RlmH [Castellaniella caeni]|uniref:23S rRNA (pseudouridine(1915)-N(3))-methyltransferase RlmH n=1 Tax=Castellaniella caeni TaxID=266123 RepID=UPI00082B891A|nr:23S rRNA (pseudouridine(1915)-N(3))-methyltransferase RlmH [Castellaniella caeni]
MKLLVYAVGNRMPGWVQDAWQDYAKRMPRECLVELHEIRPEPRTHGKTAAQLMQAEAQRIEAAVPPSAWRVILDEHGQDLSTQALAGHLRTWMGSGQDVALIVGGPDGLAPSLKQGARQMLRLSSLTLPHPMVRVLLVEQLYRAWSILAGHPYHRA